MNETGTSTLVQYSLAGVNDKTASPHPAGCSRRYPNATSRIIINTKPNIKLMEAKSLFLFLANLE